MQQPITVPQLTAPTRLDKFLVKELPKVSRAVIQRAIKNGDITINNKKVTVHHWLKSGETITVANLISQQPNLSLTPTTKKLYELIANTSDYLIINKPAGVTVHPAPGLNDSTLIESLITAYPELSKVGEDQLRPGIVHRLDKDVSGVMVVARTQTMFDCLKMQFANRKVKKIYTALVIGNIKQPSGTINFPLARSLRHGGKIAARPHDSADTRQAVTHFTVQKNFQQTTLLEITIDTGRTHQIRAHLAALGHPIVGDLLYRPAKITFKANPGRPYLHAKLLGFTDLNNNWQEYQSALPTELTDFLNKLI